MEAKSETSDTTTSQRQKEIGSEELAVVDVNARRSSEICRGNCENSKAKINLHVLHQSKKNRWRDTSREEEPVANEGRVGVVKQQHTPNAVRDAVMIAVVIVGGLCVFGMALRKSEPVPPEEPINLGPAEEIDDYPERFGKSMKAWGEKHAERLCEEEK